VKRAAPVSVVISTFEEGERLYGTVKSVLANSYAPVEIIIVDDGSTDGSCERDWPPAVRLLRQQHVGIAYARNAGAAIATQPVLVFLDAHCEVDSEWLLPLLRVLDREPDALVGPGVRDARQPRHIGCGAHIVDAVFTYSWYPAKGRDVIEVGLVPGGCLAVHRECFISSGGFGPFRAFGLEDVDLALRWWRSGRPILGVGESRITHHFRASAPYQREAEAWIENILRTALRHLRGDKLRSCILTCAQFASFNSAVAAILMEQAMSGAQQILARECRTIDSYIERWAPSAWRGPPEKIEANR
jgi:glycosyltransferase involved in cell wall biosynthesis